MKPPDQLRTFEVLVDGTWVPGTDMGALEPGDEVKVLEQGKVLCQGFVLAEPYVHVGSFDEYMLIKEKYEAMAKT